MVAQQNISQFPPLRYTHAKIDDFTYERFARTVEGPGKTRLLRVANAKAAYADRVDQDHALARAAQEELATTASPTTAERNILGFQQDMDPQLRVKPGEPNPYLEERRPRWAHRGSDQNVLEIGDKVAAIGEMSWRSRPIVMPLTNQFYGSWQKDGSFKTASIMADIRQGAAAAAPLIAFERHGFKEVNGKVETLDGIHRYELTLPEAANLARGLLLLIDLATETPDEIGGA